MTMLATAAPVEAFHFGSVPSAQPDLPGFARIGAKLSRAVAAAIAATGGATRIGTGDVRIVRFEEWKRGQGPVVAVARYRDRAIKGGMLVSVSPKLIATLVDRFYGGTGAVDDCAVSLGMTEQRLFDRLAARIGAGLATAWADIAPLAPIVASSIFAVEDVALCKAADLVAVQMFTATDPHAGSVEIEFVYPLAWVRGFAGIVGDPVKDDATEADPAWRARLSDAVMQARLPVRTVIARPTLGLSQLMALAPGDFIPVTLPARVPVTVAGRLLAHGTIGEANGRAAIKIDKLEHGAFFDD